MFLSVILLLIQWLPFVRAQFCQLSRAFLVENCTACPTRDITGDATTAVCDIYYNSTANTTSVCKCATFPENALQPTSMYYVHVTETTKTCTIDWEVAPRLFIFFKLVQIGLLLYVAVHLGYNMWLSGLCSCQRSKCTKLSLSALFCALTVVINAINNIFGIIGPAFAMRMAYGAPVGILWIIVPITWNLFISLLSTSVFDTAFSGDSMARRRCCVSVLVWLVTIVSILLWYFRGMLDLRGASSNVFVVIVLESLNSINPLVCLVVMIVAHRKMLQVREELHMIIIIFMIVFL